MGRMAVVGCEASGKTVFLSALADLYRPNGKDPAALCLMPENQAANRFAAFQQRQMRSLRQWPPATNPGKTLQMDWTLRSAGKKVIDVSMLEFGGEVFRAAFRDPETESEHQQAAKELMDYLTGADFIVLLVSIKDLMRDPGEATPDQFERDTESLWVTRGLLEFLRKELPGVGAVIGLTQADRYGKELAEAGDPKGLLALRWPSVGVLVQDIPVVAVASVSATDEEGRPVEGYTTEGILPVMREMARQEFGEPDDARSRLAKHRQLLESMKPMKDVAAYQREVDEFSMSIDNLAAAVALIGGTAGEEISEAREALERFRAVSAEANANAARRRQTWERVGFVVRVILRILLVLAVAAAAVSVLMVSRSPESEALMLSEQTNEPENTPVTESAPAVTNDVTQASVTEAVVVIAPTNDVPKADSPIPVVDSVVTNVPAAEVQQSTAVTNEAPVVDTQSLVCQTNAVPAVDIVAVAETNKVVLVEKPQLATEPKSEVKAPVKKQEPAPVIKETAQQRRQRLFDKCVKNAEAGDAKSKRILASHYLRGSEFVVQNVERARMLYREAAVGGDAKAMYYVGLEYLDAVDKDPLARHNARSWFEKAKAAGYTAADLDKLIEETR